MPDPYEIFVRWYLRFNGYFGVENFVIHMPTGKGIPQGSEADLLAVRFPHSKEVLGFEIETHQKLLDQQAVKDKLIDFVIAEVKSGQRLSLNPLWSSPSNGDKIKNLSYLVRWCGCLDDEQTIEGVASDLQSKQRAIKTPYLFRLVYFAHRKTKQAVPESVLQITFKEIAEFFVKVRGPCWQDHGFGVRSAHDQWDTLIKKVWKISEPTGKIPDEEKITSILKLLRTCK